MREALRNLLSPRWGSWWPLSLQLPLGVWSPPQRGAGTRLGWRGLVWGARQCWRGEGTRSGPAGDPPVPLWGLAGTCSPSPRSLPRGKEGAGVLVPVVQLSIKYRLLSNFVCRKCRNTALCEHNLCHTPRRLELALQPATGLSSILRVPLRGSVNPSLPDSAEGLSFT